MAELSANVASLFLPLSDSALILPSVCVAEVVLARQLNAAIASPFLLGTLSWREQEIPVISFEGLRDGQQPADLAMRQIAVINGLSRPEGLPFYGVALAAVPHVLRLASADLQLLEGELPAICHSRVSVEGREAIIPDCGVMENSLIEALQ